MSHSAALFGLVGDVITFAGAFLLAVNEALRARRFSKAGRIERFFEGSELTKILIDGVPIREFRDIEYALERRSSRLALAGAITLATGFLFILAARLLELLA